MARAATPGFVRGGRLARMDAGPIRPGASWEMRMAGPTRRDQDEPPEEGQAAAVAEAVDPVDAVEAVETAEEERLRLQRRLGDALARQEKRQKQLAAAETPKGKKKVVRKQVARRRRQVDDATAKVLAIKARMALLSGTGEASDGSGPDGVA